MTNCDDDWDEEGEDALLQEEYERRMQAGRDNHWHPLDPEHDDYYPEEDDEN
jgi:hypothetical protein